MVDHSIGALFKRLREEAKAYESTGKRYLRQGDPAKGIEYNKLIEAHRVSKKKWDFDIARTPQVVRDFNDRTDMHGEAWNANRWNTMINYRDHRVKGRGR